MIQVMGGGAEQRMIKYRFCRHYDGTQKSGYSNIETYLCMGGFAPPLAPSKIIIGLSPT